jgi:hypothetical protein
MLARTSFVTVTKLFATKALGESVSLRPCRWCRRPVVPVGRGRPPEFCRRSCRQRDYESRQEARRLGLDDERIIVTRGALDRVLDDVYVLVCAVDDLAADLGTSGVDLSEVRIHVQGLVAAASPLRSALRP